MTKRYHWPSHRPRHWDRPQNTPRTNSLGEALDWSGPSSPIAERQAKSTPLIAVTVPPTIGGDPKVGTVRSVTEDGFDWEIDWVYVDAQSKAQIRLLSVVLVLDNPSTPDVHRASLYIVDADAKWLHVAGIHSRRWKRSLKDKAAEALREAIDLRIEWRLKEHGGQAEGAAGSPDADSPSKWFPLAKLDAYGCEDGMVVSVAAVLAANGSLPGGLFVADYRIDEGQVVFGSSAIVDAVAEFGLPDDQSDINAACESALIADQEDVEGATAFLERLEMRELVLANHGTKGQRAR